MQYMTEKDDLFSLTKELSNKDLPMELPVILGFSDNGEVVVEDLTEVGNIIIGGETGSGKSTFLHSLICSLIIRYTPAHLKLFLIDTKRVEFSAYANLPHLYHPVLNDAVGSISALQSLVNETDRRLESKYKHPSILVIIDTFSDLIYINKNRFIELIKQITDKSDKTNIHIIMADSRVGPEIFTPELLSMFKTKIAFRTADGEAVKLLMGKDTLINTANPGEMLYLKNGNENPIKISGLQVEEDFVQSAVERAAS